MNIRELRKAFPFITTDELKYAVKHNEYKTERGFLKRLAQINAKYEEKANRKDILSITIKIVWKRSSVWGSNPYAEYWVRYADGTTNYGKGYTCSGCGYDKTSTVIAEIFNQEFSGMLYRKRHSRKKAPYGIRMDGWFPSFSGGVGESCYGAISSFLGGHWKHVAWSDNFDQFEANFKCKKKAA